MYNGFIISKQNNSYVVNHIFTYIISFCLLMFTTYSWAQAPKLTDNAKLSLLTCSSGDELYSVFGHSALRVVDDSLDIDIVFNYGTFDFDTPNFYLKFMRGDLNYMLSASDYKWFIKSYKRDNRSVVEGELLLDTQQKQELWDFLVWNIQPQNRNYRYDFFFDNCATRIRDIVFKAKGINHTSIKKSHEANHLSFRDYIHSYVPEYTWTAQGIDLLLGIKTDRYADVVNRAYLPLYLDSLFIDVNLIDKQTILLDKYDSNDENQDVNVFMFTPNIVLSFLLIIVVMFTITEYLRNFYCKWLDVVLFTSSSLLGLLFWFLWLFTKHDVCSWNINVMWASLLYIPIIIMLFRQINSTGFCKSIKLIKYITCINLAFLVAFILLSVLGVQDVASMSILFSISLIIRNCQLYYQISKVG